MGKTSKPLDTSHELPDAPHHAELEAGDEVPVLETHMPPRLPKSIMSEKVADVVYPTRGKAVEVLENGEDYPAAAGHA